MEERENLQPPRSPEIERKIHFKVVQLVGMPLILLLPLLALFGVFGPKEREVEKTGDYVDLQVIYPERLRYSRHAGLQITVQNNRERSLSSVRVGISRQYMEKFSQVSFHPGIREVTEGYYVVELNDISAGETRIISVEFEPAEAGRHRGTVTISGPGTERVETEIATFILP